MRTLPRFSHKDYVYLADIVSTFDNDGAGFPDGDRARLAEHFSDALRGTNPQYSADRFIAAATGKPYSRRDVQR